MNKIITLLLLLITALPAVYAGWVDENGEPSWLVYGNIMLDDGSTANGAAYTIRTYNFDAGGELLSVQTGIVGEIVPGYLYNSRNLIDTKGDTVLVEIKLGDKTATIVHSVSNSEEELHVIALGDIRLTSGGANAEEQEDTTGVHVSKVILTRGEYLSVGEVLGAGVKVDNMYDMDLKDVTVTVGVPDLGVYRRAGPFDLDSGDKELRQLYIEIPEWAKPGDYTIRIDISSDKVQRVLHRVFTVTE
jgi:hypothetical protein